MSLLRWLFGTPKPEPLRFEAETMQRLQKLIGESRVKPALPGTGVYVQGDVPESRRLRMNGIRRKGC